MFLFNMTLGSLLWLFELGLAVLLITTGRRITASERRRVVDEQQAIDRILSQRRAETGD